MKKVRLSRRTLLKGLGGVAVGLPVLECMLDRNGEALAQSVPLPKRYAIVFAGQANRDPTDPTEDGTAAETNLLHGAASSWRSANRSLAT